MTMQAQSDWTCPACRAKNTATTWATVNVTLNPELAERIIDGSLFMVRCVRCNYTGRFNYPIQFHDMTREVYYAYCAPQQPLTREDRKAMQSMAKQFSPTYQFRTVYDLNDFIELVCLWRDKLDDATMLCLRLILAVQVEEAKGVFPTMMHFHRLVMEPEPVLEYVVILNEEDKPITMQASARLYTNLFPEVKAVKPKIFPPGEWIDWTQDTAIKAMPA